MEIKTINVLPVIIHFHKNHTHAFNIGEIELDLLEYILGTITKKIIQYCFSQIFTLNATKFLLKLKVFWAKS